MTRIPDYPGYLLPAIANRPARAGVSKMAATPLTRLDRHALFIGMSDGAKGLKTLTPLQRRRVSVRLRIFFGMSVAQPLANPRLEALRQIAASIVQDGLQIEAGNIHAFEVLSPALIEVAVDYVESRLAWERGTNTVTSRPMSARQRAEQHLFEPRLAAERDQASQGDLSEEPEPSDRFPHRRFQLALLTSGAGDDIEHS